MIPINTVICACWQKCDVFIGVGPKTQEQTLKSQNFLEHGVLLRGIRLRKKEIYVPMLKTTSFGKP